MRFLLRVALAVVAGACVAIGYMVSVATPPGPRSLAAFDADRVAALETDMWRAYYDHRNAHLFTDLVTMTHEQYRYPWSKATVAGFHLARAASRFAVAHGYYEEVLPDLEQAYTIAREWTHASFDPKSVARAELAWWVARRIPGDDSPEHVGGLIADLYAQLYEVPRERVLAAATLRARAGWLRDQGGDHADWAQVSTLLLQSYRELHAAVAVTAAR